MSDIKGTGFHSVADTEDLMGKLTQAAATNMGRFTVRQDFSGDIGDYLYNLAPLWSKLPKEPAEADLVREIRTSGLPLSGFANKQDLNTGVRPAPGNRHLTNDPGQEVKAVSGYLDWTHYARSLYAQQGQPFGDQIAKDSDQMLRSTAQTLELGVMSGNATTNPLEFNGISQQIQAAHIIPSSILSATPDNIGQRLCEVVTRAMSSRMFNRRITDILCSGSGFNLLQKEVENKRLHIQTREISPGLQVPSIMTPSGLVPIMMSPFLDDVSGGGTNPDTIRYYLIDIDSLRWKGVRPYGGANNLEPQIFDVSSFVANVALTEQRMVICYGTLYAGNRGDGIWRLDVSAPPGTAWSYNS